ncbi:MAG: helix-hairpin-helix domain-containing protein [Burkholderiaceae bacterium]
MKPKVLHPRRNKPAMLRPKRNPPMQLEDLPNIGKSIAAYLRRIGILWPNQLAKREPIGLYRELSEVMGHRHDPCVLYTLMAAKHFLECGEALPWWNFTAEGKNLLKSDKKGSQT